MLHGLSSPGGCLHEAVEAAGCVALGAAAKFAFGFVSGLAGEVGLGWAVVEHPPVDDVVQDAVELAVPKGLSRWRVILPEDASKGPTPARAEKAASERNRPGWGRETSSWAALIGPTPGWPGRAGMIWVTSWRS